MRIPLAIDTTLRCFEPIYSELLFEQVCGAHFALRKA